MAPDLGPIALLVPSGRDAARPALVAELEREVDGLGLAYRRVTAPGDARLVVHCGGHRSMVSWLPSVVGTDTVVGVFPGGAVNDFARTFGLDTNPGAAALLLASPRVMRVDVGRVRLGDGTDAYVFNDAVAGLGAEVVRRNPRGRVRRLLAWYHAMARYAPPRFDVDMTFAEWHDTAVQVRVAIGQYGLDGLHVAPHALPDDGAWDVQVWSGPKTLPFTTQPLMTRGEHLPHAHVSQWRQKRVEIAATPPALVAVDDRVVGRTPAVFTIEPGALRLKI